MNKSLYTILDEISQLKNTEEKVNALRTSVYVEAFKTLFNYTFNPEIKWLLPEGVPPYKESDQLDIEGRLLYETRKLYLYVEGGNPNLTKTRRETLFVQLLESLDKNDAKLLLSIKDGKLPFKGLSKKIVLEAFPDLIPAKEEVTET